MRGIVALVLAVALVGCVPKAKYETLEGQLEACREQGQKRDAAAKRRAEAQQALALELKPLIEKGLLGVEEENGRTVIGMRAEVLFPSGSAELSPEGRDTVRQIAAVLSRRTEANFQVEGHTDDQPIATPEFPDNWHLGATRAIVVVEEMMAAGMPGDRLSAATFGQHAPVGPNTDEASRSRNRRIEIVVLPEVDGPAGRPGGPRRPPGTPGERPPRPPR